MDREKRMAEMFNKITANAYILADAANKLSTVLDESTSLMEKLAKEFMDAEKEYRERVKNN